MLLDGGDGNLVDPAPVTLVDVQLVQQLRGVLLNLVQDFCAQHPILGEVAQRERPLAMLVGYLPIRGLEGRARIRDDLAELVASRKQPTAKHDGDRVTQPLSDLVVSPQMVQGGGSDAVYLSRLQAGYHCLVESLQEPLEMFLALLPVDEHNQSSPTVSHSRAKLFADARYGVEVSEKGRVQPLGHALRLA